MCLSVVQDSAKQGVVPGLGAQQMVLDTEELVSVLNDHVSSFMLATYTLCIRRSKKERVWNH